jgi:hypothetical protein
MVRRFGFVLKEVILPHRSSNFERKSNCPDVPHHQPLCTLCTGAGTE